MPAPPAHRELSTLSPEIKIKLKQQIQGLLNSEENERPEQVNAIISLVKSLCEIQKHDSVCIEITGQIIEHMLSYLLSIKSSYESDYYKFLSLLNQMPIPEQSPFYQMLLGSMKDELENNPQDTELLAQLQILHVMTELGDEQAASQMMDDLEPQIDITQKKMRTIFILCRSSVLRMQNKHEELLRSQLEAIADTYQQDGPDSATSFLIRWIMRNHWGKHQNLKKSLLMLVYNSLGEQRSLNNALALYELFCMEDRLVSSAEKLAYQKKLIKLPASILNIKQLQHLYFFAGNFTCGMQSKFKESIRNYQYSNYFLHKRWEQLLSMSQFLREHLQPEVYFQALPYLEKSIHELSNQVSLQNNAYVESLQAGYDKIEELYTKVGEMSMTDSLTGLKNRRYMDSNLPQLISFAVRHEIPVTLAMIDIDFFKRVNDTFGHQAGDYILKSLSRILIGQFRQSDIIIRYGGEEFLVVLFGLDLDRSFTIMEELRLLIQSHSFVYRQKVIPITISIGIAGDELSPMQTPDLTKLIANSDKAMYQAKNANRNKVVIYKPRRRPCDIPNPVNEA